MDFDLGPSYGLPPTDYSPVTGVPGTRVPTLTIHRRLKLKATRLKKPPAPKAPSSKSAGAASPAGSTRPGTPASPTLSVVTGSTPPPPPTAAVTVLPFSHYP